MKENVKHSIKEKERTIYLHNAYVWIKDIILIIIGAYFISLGINMFLLPHKMTTGGASGIATILYYVLNIPMGVTILLINLPLFIISLVKLGGKFSLKTILSTVLLSVFLEIFKYESLILQSNTDLFTSCVFGGLITGVGLSLTFRAGASSGGSDLLAQIIYKLTSIQSLSNILLMIEIIIISSVIIVFKDLNLGLYSIVSMFISTKVIDVIFEGVYYTKEVTIITKKGDKVIEAILTELKRGATVTNSIGAHSKEEMTTITCIITRPQVAKIKRIIKENDSHALMYITTVNEALGRGFKSIQ